MTLGIMLKNARTEACLTQKQLADILGIVPQSISCYERDVITPALPVLKKYSEYFHLDSKVLSKLKYERKNQNRIK